jgi:hypothetical protein
MKLATYIRNIIFLWRENRREEVNLKIDENQLIGRTQNSYKKKNSYIRNQVGKLVRKIRKVRPYQIIDYSKAKQFYETQPEGIDFSKVKTGNYVVKFTKEYATKGRRWCEYHMNFDRGLGTYKVNNEYPDFFSLVNYKDDVAFALHEYHTAMFRFATKEEIQEFKNRRKEYKQKKKEIEALQKQISKLYKQL